MLQITVTWILYFAGDDYNVTQKILVFAAHDHFMVKCLCTTIPINDDTEEEDPESFNVSLSTTADCVTTQSTPSTIIIVDNDNDEDTTEGSQSDTKKSKKSKKSKTSTPKDNKVISEDQPTFLGGFDPIVQTETEILEGITY